MKHVDVGGYRLAVEESGPADAIPVVFVSGVGEGRPAWAEVIAQLPGVRTIVYDRAGIDASDARPRAGPVTFTDLAEELDALLDALSVADPAVVVGHSIGALIVRAFLAGHPQRVHGLVIVDGSVPEVRLIPTEDPLIDGDRPDSSPIEPGGVPLPSPGRPAVVVTRARGTWTGPWAEPWIDEYWQRAQREVATALGAVQVLAASAGHRLNEETPELVALAVRAVLAAPPGTVPILDPDAVRAADGQTPISPQ